MPGDRRTAVEAVRERPGVYVDDRLFDKPVRSMSFGDARDAVETVVTTLRTPL